MKVDLVHTYDRLMENCRAAEYAGYDPFDGLESRIFQATPVRRFRPTRLLWQQAVKRSPINLRPLLMVPKGINPKGIALFTLAAISRYRAENSPEHRADAETLMAMLLGCAVERQSKGTLSFGYNFDWQSRAFFAPKGMPTIVPTAFAARAIFEYAQAFGNSRFEQALDKVARFVCDDLRRTHETPDEVCFSYTPADDTKIYNASLLSAEALAYAGSIGGQPEYLGLTRKAVRFVLNGQRADGSWLYGPGEIHGWVDNFHTAFVLDSLRRISELVPTVKEDTEAAIERGFAYWLDNFFHDNGASKYFDKGTYPIDIHSAAAAIVTLSGFARSDERALPLARKIAEWTVTNMIGPDGNTYYQKRRFYTVKTPFMRWGQAWMAYAFALLIEAEHAR